jgi:hypothetical protein
MRSAIFLSAWLAAALPVIAVSAHAQTCEGSAIGKAGEVFVTATARGETATWIVERIEGEGIETANFSRPSLMLDFIFAGGDLKGPEATVVSISRISSGAAGRAPDLGTVWVEARMDQRVIDWRASESGKGERALADALSRQWPGELVITLQADRHGGAELASAKFPLARLPDAQQLAREALAARKCPG